MANFSLLAKLGLDSKAFQTGLKGAQGSAGAFSSSMKKLFAAATGGSLLIAAKRAIDLGSRISDLSVQLNIGAESLQSLQFAAQEAGVKSKTLERALRDMQLRAQEAIKGNKSYAEAFEQLGINVAEFAGMNTEQKFEAIARAQANATDKQMAFANVARILGERAGPELNEVLKKLANEGLSAFEKAARDAGQVLDASTIKSLDKASDTLAAFGKAITVLAANAIEPILPILTKFTDYVSRNAKEVARGVKNIVAFTFGFRSAKKIIPVVTGMVNLFSGAIRGATVSTFSLSAAITTLKNSIRRFAASTLMGVAFVALSVGAEKLTMKLLRAKKGGDELKAEMDSLNNQTDEFVRSLKSQINKMDESAESAENYANKLSDVLKLEKIVKNAQRERAKNHQDLIDKQRASFIAAKKLQALELRASGGNAQAKALEKQIELMKETIRISREYGISLEKAAELVRGGEANKPKEGNKPNGGDLRLRTATGGISSLAAIGGGGRMGMLKPVDKLNKIANDQLAVLKNIERNTQPQTSNGTSFK